MKGYKYICDYFDYENYQKYLNKSENNEILSHDELNISKGYYDKEEICGIYFCESQEDLLHWVKEIFDWETGIGALDIIEITPVGEVKERIYADGRKAYVVNSAYVRILDIHEILPQINQTCDKYFKY